MNIARIWPTLVKTVCKINLTKKNMAFSKHTSAILSADNEARTSGKQKMVVFNSQKGLYFVKTSVYKKKIGEKIVYYTR